MSLQLFSLTLPSKPSIKLQTDMAIYSDVTGWSYVWMSTKIMTQSQKSQNVMTGRHRDLNGLSSCPFIATPFSWTLSVFSLTPAPAGAICVLLTSAEFTAAAWQTTSHNVLRSLIIDMISCQSRHQDATVHKQNIVYIMRNISQTMWWYHSSNNHYKWQKKQTFVQVMSITSRTGTLHWQQ